MWAPVRSTPSAPAGNGGTIRDMAATDLPNWPQIRDENPDLAARLAADRTDHRSLVEYLCLTLGATIVSELEQGPAR